MSDLFFEIKNGNFVASEKNKVNNVKLKIKQQGEIVSLLGPSGVGKTTILTVVISICENLFGRTVISTREPAGTRLAERFREILLPVSFR